MFAEAYKRAWNVIIKKPIRLWGLSLLSGLICVLAIVLTMPALFVVGLAISLVIKAGMSKVYLDGLRGKEVNSDQIFEGFHHFGKVAGGMAWRELWVFIWALIPFAGFVFAIIKGYEYAFTPYILMTDESATATSALRTSKEKTKGMKGQMFLADLIIYAGIFVGVLILAILSAIPFIGVLFRLVLILALIAICIFLPIFTGLYQAAFFEIAGEGGAQKYARPAYTAPQQQYYAPQQPQAPYVDPQAQAPQAPQAPETPQAPQEPQPPVDGVNG